MEYYIGIDGGGTNSRLLAADGAGNPIGKVFGGSTNLASNPRDLVYETLKRLFSDLFAKSILTQENCRGVCIGSAGLDFDDACEQMENMIQSFGFVCPIVATNDSVLVLSAATGGKPGVILISGTGSIAYGLNDKGVALRCGGWGHILDDGGSGYWIAKEALRRAFLSFDRRGEKTILEDTFRKVFHVDDLPRCIDRIYGENALGKAEIAKFSVLVEEGARRNDAVCLQILEDAAGELFVLADTVLREVGSGVREVVVSGGNIVNNVILLEMFNKRMKESHPDIHVLKIEKEPVWGAVYLAMQQTVPALNIEKE